MHAEVMTGEALCEERMESTGVASESEPVMGHAAADAAEPGVDAAETGEPGERLVPVSEAKKYRKRAQAAESCLEDARAQLARNEEELRRSEAMIASLQRRLEIDEALVRHDALDLEAARLLVTHVLEEGAAEDVPSAVAEVERRKPALFRRPRSAAAQAARDGDGISPHRDHLAQCATVAAATGSRRDVLRYLRLRRRS